MKLRTIAWTAIALLGSAWLWMGFEHANTLTIADKACLRAHNGSPAAPAKAHLREIAKSQNAEVVESGDRVTATFRSWSSTRVCAFRVVGDVVADRTVGSPASVK